MQDSSSAELEAVQLFLTTLNRFNEEARARIIKTAATFFGLDVNVEMASSRGARSPEREEKAVGNSEARQISPKDFLFEKKPQTNTERMACLAYYLTHYRNQKHFKTLDLSVLNTDAAQPKFTNATYAANDALKNGLLALATKGQRQISALGEQFVLALPDRDAAKALLVAGRRRRARSRKRGGEGPTEFLDSMET